MDSREKYGWPEDVFEEEDVFAAAVAALDISREKMPTDAVTQELMALLGGWIAAHEDDPDEPPERLAWAKESLAELTADERELFQLNLEVARKQEALEAAREKIRQSEDSLRDGYRSMVFWQGRDAPDVREAERMVRERVDPATAERILDLTRLFDDDIPEE